MPHASRLSILSRATFMHIPTHAPAHTRTHSLLSCTHLLATDARSHAHQGSVQAIDLMLLAGRDLERVGSIGLSHRAKASHPRIAARPPRAHLSARACFVHSIRARACHASVCVCMCMCVCMCVCAYVCRRVGVSVCKWMCANGDRPGEVGEPSGIGTIVLFGTVTPTTSNRLLGVSIRSL